MENPQPGLCYRPVPDYPGSEWFVCSTNFNAWNGSPFLITWQFPGKKWTKRRQCHWDRLHFSLLEIGVEASRLGPQFYGCPWRAHPFFAQNWTALRVPGHPIWMPHGSNLWGGTTCHLPFRLWSIPDIPPMIWWMTVCCPTLCTNRTSVIFQSEGWPWLVTVNALPVRWLMSWWFDYR